METANGEALIQRMKYATGGKWMPPVVVPCRITVQRVYLDGHIFQRGSGKRLSRYDPSRKPTILLAYQFNGGHSERGDAKSGPMAWPFKMRNAEPFEPTPTPEQREAEQIAR